MLVEFWGVTNIGDVLRVRSRDPVYPTIEKMAGVSDRHMVRGQKISGGEKGKRILIGKSLQPFTSPEDKSLPQLDRPSSFYRETTGPIAGLYFEEAEIGSDYLVSNLRVCDFRFYPRTMEVLAAIGDDHPVFYVSGHPLLSLIPLK